MLITEDNELLFSVLFELEFTLFVNGVNSSEQCDEVYSKLVAACPDNWEIK